MGARPSFSAMGLGEQLLSLTSRGLFVYVNLNLSLSSLSLLLLSVSQ